MSTARDNGSGLSSRFLAEIIDALAHPVFVKDRAFDFVLVNRANAEMLGLTVEIKDVEQRVAVWLQINPTGSIIEKLRWLGLFSEDKVVSREHWKYPRHVKISWNPTMEMKTQTRTLATRMPTMPMA